jgi:hypothetical protein
VTLPYGPNRMNANYGSAMTHEQLDLKQLEKTNPIIEVAVELGIKVQGSMGRCFNEGRHGSEPDKLTLFFNPAKNTFQCQSCSDVGGSVVDLVCQVRGWDSRQATDWLVHRADFNQMTRKLYQGKGKKK